jgi:hypothetical protein
MADTSAKKRKRPDGQHGEAKKKIAFEEEALPHSISVSSVVRPRFSPPVIGTTILRGKREIDNYLTRL